MATIKRNGNRILLKIVNGVRRATCSCCTSCFCSELTLDDFIPVATSTRASIPFVEIASECGNIGAFNALRPNADYKKRPACLRWLCRRVVLENGLPTVESQAIGGPTTNNRNLNELLLECLGSSENGIGLVGGGSGASSEQYNQCYLYEFEFYGWGLWGKKTGGPSWISSDLIYNIRRADSGP
jgi:hypothetical protein